MIAEFEASQPDASLAAVYAEHASKEATSTLHRILTSGKPEKNASMMLDTHNQCTCAAESTCSSSHGISYAAANFNTALSASVHILTFPDYYRHINTLNGHVHVAVRTAEFIIANLQLHPGHVLTGSQYVQLDTIEALQYYTSLQNVCI
jgi:hypothetical protein